MDFSNLIGYEIHEAINIIKNFSNKQIIVKDNNSNVKNYNVTNVIRITEEKDFIKIIISNFIYLD